MAPRTNAAGQPSSGTRAWNAAATAAVVAATRPTASSEMESRLSRKSLHDVK